MDLAKTMNCVFISITFYEKKIKTFLIFSELSNSNHTLICYEESKRNEKKIYIFNMHNTSISFNIH